MFTVVDSSRARLIKGTPLSVFKVLDSQNVESILYNAGAIDGLTKEPQTLHLVQGMGSIKRVPPRCV